MEDDDLKALEKLLNVRDERGRVVLTFGLLATFYLKEPWTRPVREAVAEEAERYIALVREHLRWAWYEEKSEYCRMDERIVGMPVQWLPQRQDSTDWELGFHGGEDENATSAFAVDAFGPEPYRKDNVGHFHVRLPLDWFLNHPGKLPDFVLQICKRLRPISGYAGIGLLTPLTAEGSQNLGPNLLGPIALRYPGLEIDDPITTALHAAKGIKGVNWLTILGDHWVQEVGGLDYLRVRLDEPNFPFYRYDGGLVIQAGQRAQIGDAERGLWPTQYVTLAKVLKKIQSQKHYPLFTGGIFDQETTNKWIYRFDGK